MFAHEGPDNNSVSRKNISSPLAASLPFIVDPFTALHAASAALSTIRISLSLSLFLVFFPRREIEFRHNVAGRSFRASLNPFIFLPNDLWLRSRKLASRWEKREYYSEAQYQQIFAMTTQYPISNISFSIQTVSESNKLTLFIVYRFILYNKKLNMYITEICSKFFIVKKAIINLYDN